jgi:hypothetical protein
MLLFEAKFFLCALAVCFLSLLVLMIPLRWGHLKGLG